MTEEEFYRKVLNIASIADTLTIEEFNGTILVLASELTIRRNARNRQQLFRMAEQEERAALDAEDGIFYAHQNDLNCGRASCTRCNGGRDVE